MMKTDSVNRSIGVIDIAVPPKPLSVIPAQIFMGQNKHSGGGFDEKKRIAKGAWGMYVQISGYLY
ncbi:MAG: hypothetical protein JSW28_06305 [Thermoplasmata archaeon]|nr:MAG: hypothetical protein JSW28_06305 [Thermoplasmata archaeon]